MVKNLGLWKQTCLHIHWDEQGENIFVANMLQFELQKSIFLNKDARLPISFSMLSIEKIAGFLFDNAFEDKIWSTLFGFRKHEKSKQQKYWSMWNVINLVFTFLYRVCAKLLAEIDHKAKLYRQFTVHQRCAHHCVKWVLYQAAYIRLQLTPVGSIIQ